MSGEPSSKRAKLNDSSSAAPANPPSNPPPTANPNPTSPNTLPEDKKLWTTDQVYQWAVEVVKVDPVDAQKLKDQKITGDVLHGMTEERLRSYGIPGGPAFKLSEAVIKMFSPAHLLNHGLGTPTSGGKAAMHIRALLLNPNDTTYRCLVDVKADTGCSIEFILSERKAQQLGLKPIPGVTPMRARTAGYSNEHKAIVELVLYSEILFIIPLGQTPTRYNADEIFALPPESKRVSTLPVLVRKTNETSATATSTGTSSANPTKEISPIKNGTDSKTKESVLLGLPGLSKLYITLNTKTSTIEPLEVIADL